MNREFDICRVRADPGDAGGDVDPVTAGVLSAEHAAIGAADASIKAIRAGGIADEIEEAATGEAVAPRDVYPVGPAIGAPKKAAGLRCGKEFLTASGHGNERLALECRLVELGPARPTGGGVIQADLVVSAFTEVAEPAGADDQSL